MRALGSLGVANGDGWWVKVRSLGTERQERDGGERAAIAVDVAEDAESVTNEALPTLPMLLRSTPHVAQR